MTPALGSSRSESSRSEPSTWKVPTWQATWSRRSDDVPPLRPVAMSVRSPPARAPALLALAVVALVVSACDDRRTPATDVAAPADGPAAAAPVASADAAAPRAQFRASGNEPFWAVQVDGDTLTWTTPEMQPGKRLTVEQATDAGGVRFFGKDGAVDFSFELTPGECQDSMSGQMFDYSAAFIHGDEKMTGCARVGLD